MINRQNWKLTKTYLDYRLSVDQVSKGSLKKEQTHMRYLLEWCQETSFRDVGTVRPSFPEYMLVGRLDGEQRQLSAVYIKKILSTVRLFFSWLSDLNTGYTHIKRSWIKTIKVKRLSDVPKVKEAVTLDEILLIASQPVHNIFERRARATCVFLFLSGIRIGAFVSLPLQAVDISNRTIIQYPSLGVRTKNRKFAITYLLDIPELLKVVQDWDNEVRRASSLFWFAPFSFETGQIDKKVVSIGEHRSILATRNIKQWLQAVGLPYHSPHKFRHGHIHYGRDRAVTLADFKAISQNVMHSSMKITDEVYSVLDDVGVAEKIKALGTGNKKGVNQDVIKALKELISNMEK